MAEDLVGNVRHHRGDQFLRALQGPEARHPFVVVVLQEHDEPGDLLGAFDAGGGKLGELVAAAGLTVEPVVREAAEQDRLADQAEVVPAI